MKRNLKKGFTLVELVIVIAVIAILSAVLIPTFGNVISNAKRSSAQSEASNAISQYVTNAASNNQDVTLPDGYVVVLNSRTELVGYTYTTVGNEGVWEVPESSNSYALDAKNISYIFEYSVDGGLGDKNVDYAANASKFAATSLSFVGSNSSQATAGTVKLLSATSFQSYSVYLLDATISGDAASGVTLKGKVLLFAKTTA